MEKIIIRINKPVSTIESITKVLIVTQTLKVASQEIYLRTMRGTISFCLS